MTIRRLPSHLVDRIAAGEVVERPASVVKELVENSLDAGAGRIEVHLSGDGTGRLQVIDDGCGMDAADMRLSIERHATSKLAGDDLLAISSFGFRGEALAAIASVSRFTLESRTRHADAGWRLALDSGAMLFDGPAGVPPGTRITVEELFARVPARAKFLKSARTEVAAVADAVRRLAMAHPAVRFLLLHEGRRIVDVAAEADSTVVSLARRVRALLPDGADTVPVDFAREDLVIGGLAGLPAASRATSEQQYLFVNGRPVKDRQLVGAMRGAYAARLPAGRHALAALFVSLPPVDVDVNVHPAKTEVRFREPARIRASLIVAVRTALDAAGIRAVQSASNLLADALQAPSAVPPAAVQMPLIASAEHAAAVPPHAAESRADWAPQGRAPEALAGPAAAGVAGFPLGLRAGRSRKAISWRKPKMRWCWSTSMQRMNGWCWKRCAGARVQLSPASRC